MSEDIFEDAPAATGAARPTIKQLTQGCKEVERTYAKGDPGREHSQKIKGRLVIIEPKEIKYNVPSNFPGQDPSDRITADIHVLDGEPIDGQYSDDGDLKQKFREPLVPPFTIPGQFISNRMLVDQLKEVVGTGFRFGRMGTLPPRGNNKKPYILYGTTAEEKKQAAEYWKKRPDPFDNA